MIPARRVVLDASAVLAWMFRERGFPVIDTLLTCSVIPAPTMVETLYRAAERGHRLATQQLHDDLLNLGVTVEPFTDDDTVRAAELVDGSRRHPSMTRKISLGDALCLAVAERLGLVVTGGDHAWSYLDLRVTFAPFRD